MIINGEQIPYPVAKPQPMASSVLPQMLPRQVEAAGVAGNCLYFDEYHLMAHEIGQSGLNDPPDAGAPLAAPAADPAPAPEAPASPPDAAVVAVDDPLPEVDIAPQRSKTRPRHANGSAGEQRDCETCGKAFVVKAHGTRRRFCSDRCRDAKYREPASAPAALAPPELVRRCAHAPCGAEFAVAAAGSKKIFCSSQCRSRQHIKRRAKGELPAPDSRSEANDCGTAPQSPIPEPAPPVAVAPEPPAPPAKRDYITTALVDLGKLPAASPGWGPRPEPPARYE